MKKAVKRRDLQFFIGATLAHKLWRGARDELNMTISEFLMMALGADGKTSEMINMFLEVADHHAEGIINAMERENSIAVVNVNQLDDEVRTTLIKEATVMAAISEAFQMLADRSLGDLDLPDPNDINEENHREALNVVLSGYEPAMVKTVSDFIVAESYPNENATQDIIAALWMEGFTVCALAEQTYEMSKDDPEGRKLIDAAEKYFIVLD